MTSRPHFTPATDYWNALSAFSRIEHAGIEFGYRRGVWSFVPLAFWRGTLRDDAVRAQFHG